MYFDVVSKQSKAKQSKATRSNAKQSEARIRIQIQISDSDSRFQIQIQIQISDSDFRFRSKSKAQQSKAKQSKANANAMQTSFCARSLKKEIPNWGRAGFISKGLICVCCCMTCYIFVVLERAGSMDVVRGLTPRLLR